MLRPVVFLVIAALAGCSTSAKPLAVVEPTAVQSEPSEPGAPEPEPVPEPEPAPDPEPTSEPHGCNPFVAPIERTGGQLIVHAPPKKDNRSGGMRMRSHVEGSLTARSSRVWVGPQVPGFLPLTEGTMELFLLDHQPDGTFLALYRDPYDASSCGGGSTNCDYVVTSFAHCGEVQWSLALRDVFSAPTHLEVQDIRLEDGTLYFNEACQSYSREAKGKCSSLVAVDPAAGQVLWRTKPLVSNGQFLIEGDYIVTGYGFTAEKDTLHVVRRSDGKVMQSLKLPKAPEMIRILEPGVVRVAVYPGSVEQQFRMLGWDTDEPRLERLP